jgi:hypothetical protein
MLTGTQVTVTTVGHNLESSQLQCTLHTAAVRGVKLVGEYAVSTGADQRLALWTLQGNNLVLLHMMCIEVADISTLEVSELLEDGSRFVVVAGVGMATIQWQLQPLSPCV